MNPLKHIWPWSRFEDYEWRLKERGDRVNEMKKQIDFHRQEHSIALVRLQEEKDRHEVSKNGLKHIATTLALRGNFDRIGLLIAFFFVCLTGLAQPVLPTILTTNPTPVLQSVTGPIITTNGGKPALTYNAGALTNYPEIWTNNRVGNNSYGFAVRPTVDKRVYLGPADGGSMTNTIQVNTYSVSGNPALADGITLNFSYSGVGNVPAAVVAALNPAYAGAVEEGNTYAYFCENNTTNADTLGWLYAGDASIGSYGNSNTQVANDIGAHIGVEGQAESKGLSQAGVSGLAFATVNGQTNIGSSGVTILNGKTGVFVGLYAQVTADGSVDPSLSSAALVCDNHTTGLPIALFQANGVTSASVSSTGGVDAKQFSINGGAQMVSGAGSPAGVVAAPVGSIYLNTSGGAGTTLYVKESGGATTAGWVGK